MKGIISSSERALMGKFSTSITKILCNSIFSNKLPITEHSEWLHCKCINTEVNPYLVDQVAMMVTTQQWECLCHIKV